MECEPCDPLDEFVDVDDPPDACEIIGFAPPLPATGKVVCPPVEFPDPKCGEVPAPMPVVGVLPPQWP